MRRSSAVRRAVVIGATVSGVVAAVVAVPAGAAVASSFTPGASGAGDPYFPLMGNGGYDVSHYDIALAFSASTGSITATATITAMATQNLSRFDLDFEGPPISAVRVNGADASFRRQQTQELVITPGRGLPNGRAFTVTVSYAGTPHHLSDPTLGDIGWLRTADGAIALNQPVGAPTYYPVNDTPQDKATYTQHITVPSGLSVLANGEGGPSVSTGGRTTWTYVMHQPMASELSSIAIGHYDVTSGSADGGNRRVPNLTAIGRDIDTHAGRGALFNRTTADVVAFESSIYGPYPFASTGGLIDDIGVQYSLEVQGRPFYGQTDSSVYGELLAHELAHQWYGDSVTPEHWSDVWLNEGFATYSQWLWDERNGQSLRRIVRQQYGFTPWRGVVADPGSDNVFGIIVYLRGALTLQALRDEVGDPAFFRILRGWAAAHRFANASTTDFIDYAAGSSGDPRVPALLHRWLFTSGRQPLP